MADLYSKWVLTNKYAQAEQDAANSGNQITFVRLILSADKFTFADLAGFNDTTLTTINAKQIVPVNYVKTDGSTVSVSTIVTSAGNTADYDANTLLLVASYKGAEFLAASAIAQTPFRITAESATELLEFTVRPQLTVSNTSAISIAVDLNAPATNERVTDEVASLNSDMEAINNDKTKLWDKIKELVTLRGTQTLDGVFTFTQKIIGRITNADSADLAGKATLLETARKIGGVSFNGGSDIDLPGVNKTGTQNTSGNAASSTKLATARKINGVAFDGGGDITVVDSTAYHKHDSPQFSDLTVTGTTTVNNLKVSGTTSLTTVSTKIYADGEVFTTDSFITFYKSGNVVFAFAQFIFVADTPLVWSYRTLGVPAVPVGYRPVQNSYNFLYDNSAEPTTTLYGHLIYQQDGTIAFDNMTYGSPMDARGTAPAGFIFNVSTSWIVG